jgi:Tfp pilus assembly protein FimT
MKSSYYLALVVLVGSCPVAAKPPAAKSKSSKTVIINRARAIRIAQQAVKANDSWANRAKYNASREGTNWFVFAQRIAGYDKKGRPLFVPGGHRVVVINKSGRVIRYMRGE